MGVVCADIDACGACVTRVCNEICTSSIFEFVCLKIKCVKRNGKEKKKRQGEGGFLPGR